MGVEELSEKYNIHTTLLLNLEKQYGSLDNFKKVYINALINNKLDNLKISKKLKENLISYFDLSNNTGVGEKNNYITLLNDIFDVNIFFLADKNIRNNIDNLISTLPDKEKTIIKMYYGLNEKEKGSKEICEKYGITRERARQIKERAIRMIKNNNNFLNLKKNVLLFEDEKEEMLNKYFKNNDIFYNPEIQDNRAIELLKIGYEIKIKNLEFNSYEECKNATQNLSQEINNLNINEDLKNNLLAILNFKKSYYETNNQKLIVAIYENKIDRIRNKNELKNILDMNISALNLQIRTYNFLLRENIFTIGDLLSVGEEKILELRNVGKKIYDDISKKLNEQGLSFITNEEKNIIENSENVEELQEEINALNLSEKNKKYLLCKLVQKKEKLKNNFQKDIVNNYLLKIENIPVFLENEEILDMNIKDLGLSTRAYNSISRANISFVIELINISREKIMNIRGLGANSFKEIEDKLNTYGIKFLTTEELKNRKYYISYKDIKNQIQNLDIDEDNKNLLLSKLEEKKLKSNEKDVDIQLNNSIEALKEEYKNLEKIEQEKMKKMEENEVSK